MDRVSATPAKAVTPATSAAPPTTFTAGGNGEVFGISIQTHSGRVDNHAYLLTAYRRSGRSRG